MKPFPLLLALSLLGLHLAPAQTLTYDFLAAKGDGLTLDASNSSALTKVTVAAQDGLSATVTEGKPGQVVLKLDIKDWAKTPGTAALVLEYYDQSSPAGLTSGGDTFDISYPTAAKPGFARIHLAGRGNANEPYRQATWRRHAAILKDFSVPDPSKATLTLKASGTCTLRAVGLQPLAAGTVTALEDHARRMQDDFFAQARLVVERSRAEELVRQLARADRYARDAGLPGWAAPLASLESQRTALLALMREAETLADQHYYAGQLGILAGRAEELTALQDRIARSRAQIQKAIAALKAQALPLLGDVRKAGPRIDPAYRREPTIRVPPHPMAATIPPYFRDRIRFFTFANSPWVGRDERWYEFLPLYGIEAMFYITGYAAATDPEAGAAPRKDKPYDNVVDERLAETAIPKNLDESWKASLDWNARQYAVHSKYGLKTMPAALHLHNLFILSGLPGWFEVKHKGEEYRDRAYDGEQNTTTHGSGTVNIWHPGIRQYVRDQAAAIGRQVASNPDLLGFSTFNEHRSSINHTKSLGYTRLAAEAFRKEMRARYPTIEKLNEAWGSTYASFDGLQPPLPREKEPWQITPLFYEWNQFVRRSLDDYARLIVQAFKQACPSKPVWLEGEMANLGDVGHVHVRPVPHVNLSNYNIHRVHRKAVVDAETAGAYPEGEKEAPAEVGKASLERNLLDALLWGQRGFDLWLRYFTSDANGYYAAFHDNPNGAMVIATRDYSSLAVLRDKADRFGNLLLNTEVVGTGVGILRYGSAMVGTPLPVDCFGALTGALYTYGYPPLAVSADELLDGLDDLKSFRALIVLHSPVVRPGLNEKLIDWVKNGGLMIAEGPWGIMNPYGKPEGALVREAFGDLQAAFPPTDEQKLAIDGNKMFRTIAEPYRALCPWPSIGEWYLAITPKAPKPGVKVLMADVQGNPILLEAPLGKGKVIMSAVPIYSLGAFIRKELNRVIPCPARGEKEGVLHTVMREDAKGGRYLGVINSDAVNAVETTLVLGGRYRAAVDLGIGNGFSVPVKADGANSRFGIRLGPGEGTLFRLER